MEIRLVGLPSEIQEFEKRVAFVFDFSMNSKVYPSTSSDTKLRRYGHIYFVDKAKKDLLYNSYLSEKQRADDLEIELAQAYQRIQELEVQLDLIPKDAAVLSPNNFKKRDEK